MKPLSIFLSILAVTFSLHANLAEKYGYEEVTDQNQLKILTPSLANRKIAKIRLNNGLEALLISDPDATESAAAFAMEVGSWSDPVKYPGMAHFTEHLLFMASETYPEENGYFKQVSNNGGMLNAFTASDRTVYMFTVNHDAFPATLDYFSHMFIDPLFSASGIGRELHAVDQEHDKNIENDSFREYMVIKNTGNPDHPNARFSTGNSETLGGIPREAVVSWYRENYSSDKAHLVIYASLPIEELKTLTVSNFSAVPQTPHSKASFPKRLTSDSQLGTLTYLTPVKEVRELTVYWELPQSFFLDLDDKSDELLSYVLQSRHPGSLYSVLKKEELIDTLHAGTASFSKESGFFALDFVLTPQGVVQHEKVIATLFQSLNTLKQQGIPPYIFNEVKNMAQIDYSYQGRERPFEYVMNAAYQMAEEPLETFPQKSILPTHYNSEKCKALISLLEPKKAQYNLKALPIMTGVEGVNKEKWSGAEYSVVKIDTAKLEKWEDASFTHGNIYPQQNPYIPTNLQLVTNQREAEEVPIPDLLINNEYGKVYYWEDGRYLVPEVSWVIGLKSPMINRKSHQIALISLFDKCITDHLKSTAFYANAASLNASIGANDFKFIIYINGFSENAPLLLTEVLKGIKTCSWTKEEFELERSMLINHYENFSKAPPLNQGIDILQNVLFDSHPRNKDQLAALRDITYADFEEFKKNFLSQAYAEMMLTGNLTEDDAYNVWNQVQTSLSYQAYPKENHYEKSLLALESNGGPYKIYEKGDCLGHSAILVLQEGPFSFDTNATAAVLSKGISEDFFDTLRTKQQTAYIAKSLKMEEEGQLLQLFLVQSSSHQPDELIARFELFLEGYVKDFDASISEGQFENIRTNLITTAKQPPPNLAEMAGQLHSLAFTHEGDFHRIQKKITSLSALDYETFKQESLAFLSRQNSKRIAIMFEGNSPQGKGFRYQDITASELKNHGDYVTWSTQ